MHTFSTDLFLVIQSVSHRRRRQYYGYPQQYGSQYGLQGPGGQGWMNMDNRYLNQPGWNNNNNGIKVIVVPNGTTTLLIPSTPHFSASYLFSCIFSLFDK